MIISLKKLLKENYRPDIDGFRAFAVIAVIINHFNKDILPSGYLGVDVFFVISGYVITSSLATRKSKDFLEFIGSFYERRIKRIIPSLIFFVLIFSFLICFFNFSPIGILRTGLASLFGVSNLYLIKQSTDYFAQSTELNVFTQTWSLGVEEQFYILFPFLIWFSGFGRQAKKGTKNLFIVILFLTTISLFSFIYFYSTNQIIAYFSMPTRFWEISIGCISFISLKSKSRLLEKYQKIPPIAVFFVLILILFLPSSYPVPSTIAIVFLSAILISCLKKGTGLFWFFTRKKVIYIGLISYPLYLWHWGVLSISRWTIGVHWWSIPFQLMLILFFSVISYEFIETPLRSKKWSDFNWKTFFKGTIALLFSGLVLIGLEKPLKGKLYLGDPNKVYFEKNHEKIKVPYFDSFKINQSCYGMDFDRGYDHKKVLDECFEQNENNQQTFFFIGDSHSQAFWLGAEFLAKKTKSNLFVFSNPGSLFPAIKYFRLEPGESFYLKKYQYFKALENEIISQSKNGDVIFINLRFPYHFGEYWYEFPINTWRFFDERGKVVTRKSKILHFEEWLIRLNLFIEKLSKNNVKVIISTPTPEYPAAKLNKCKEQNLQWFNNLYAVGCTYNKTFFNSKSGKYYFINRKLSDITSKNDNLFLFDALSAICQKSSCKRTLEDKLLYNDHNHITNFASRNIIAPKMLKFLEDNQIINIDND